ncbi:DUF2642 domain-containing protein [Aneurinibacillus uraniidurans]|uniref:DUF2642 domain-containing protein n=1 Tax=Aneurinibacillus uraniidurans TaxID=2966586 RepID=UPI00234B0FAF|nr:DUF2642 domain-containing protein [Aneurinibacillus sp. B1]WCN37254.1 DUF2642 domain-containing protein [Aneurinibacillus sp. B1]
MNSLSTLLGKPITVELSGKIIHTGILNDYGRDIIILYNGQQFLYIPMVHVQSFQLSQRNDIQTVGSDEKTLEQTNSQISYRSILNNAREVFVEVYVTGTQSIHGYIKNVLSDYIVFYSPIYKTMYISLQHLKWLIPYPTDKIPYSLDQGFFTNKQSDLTLSRTLKEQLKKLEGKMIVLDMGKEENKVGLLNKLGDHTLELIIPYEKKLYWNLQHLKIISLS